MDREITITDAKIVELALRQASYSSQISISEARLLGKAADEIARLIACPPNPPMTNAQRQILSGLLSEGHCYMSATEAAEKDFMTACGWVECWDTVGGFPAWRITQVGRAALGHQQAGE